MRTYLAPAVMSSFNSALSKLTGYKKRDFAAELCEEYFDSSPRKMERYFDVGRDMVSLGLHERRTGIRCIDAHELKGAKKKEKVHRDLRSDIEEIVGGESQIDPQFKTQRCYVKISAAHIRKELVLNKSYELSDLCLKTVDNVLNRLGYTLKKVLKTKPLKKIPETDAIFENVHKQHQTARADPRILRVSVDVKAKVKIGNLSRKGYCRTKNAPKTDDHDQHWTDVLAPFGLHEVNTGNTFLVFGNSKETPDFIADCFEWWWQQRQFMADQYDLLMIDLDNGKSVAGNTKRFLQRMVEFSKKIGIPVQLVYYPPYHSKYNMVERSWAALENYWSALVLDTVINTINIAKKAAWKGMNPIVHFLDRTYQKGITVDSGDFKELQKFIFRNPDLPKWDVLINFNESG